MPYLYTNRKNMIWYYARAELLDLFRAQHILPYYSY